jgi:ATP-dependent helicase HrpB
MRRPRLPRGTRYLGRDARAPIERQAAEAALRALRAERGSVLVFLPGAAEIRRAEALLRERISDPSIDVVALHGALDTERQDRAIAPPPAGRRKAVLATSIAETSLTIEGVRIVVDCGLARVPRYEPDLDLTTLETVRVARSSADQRRGRAGRTEPGICYRLWEEPQTASLEPANRPEMLAADLSGFVLDLAHWGVRAPSSLVFLDPPPAVALSRARALLAELGALDENGRITPAGNKLRALPLPPRLGRMLLYAAQEGAAELAADIALVLTEPGLGGTDVDLRDRVEKFRADRSSRALEARALGRQWARTARSNAVPSPQRPERQRSPAAAKDRTPSIGMLIASAYPDRVARSRGSDASFLLANGRGAAVDPASALAREPFLAVAAVSGAAGQGRIVMAAPLTLGEIEAMLGERMAWRDELVFDESTASLRARRVRALGALALAEQPQPVAADEESARVLAEGVVRLGMERLPWTSALRQWRDRVMFLRRVEGCHWPDLGDAALAASAGEWLSQALLGKTSLAQLGAGELAQALHNLLASPLRRRLDVQAPTHFTAPSGRAVPIDYAGDAPKISVRVQELFGLSRHPVVSAGRVPLLVVLLSPAQRPVQMTRDLPGFWRGTYAAVKAEMKGRYPRHYWPDDPLAATPAARPKPRMR